MAEPVSLIPVRPSDLAIGKPVKSPIYDWHGKLLLGAGAVIGNQTQLDGLISNGFVHDASWDIELTPSRIASPVIARSDKLRVNNKAAVPPEETTGGKEVITDMDEVRWYVGETLYLQLADQPSVRYVVKLIGFVKNKTVFVTPPALDGKLEFVREGQTFIVRAFSGKNAYAFTAAAVKSVHTPHPYLHLSYPKQVRCTVVRQGARAEVKIIASVSTGNPERTGAATLTDLSMGGASGVLKELLGKKGDEGRIKMKVQAAGQDEYLNVKMIMRSITTLENGQGFKYGFEFVDMSPHEKVVLSAFVNQTLVEMS
jgi:c-di-GMP-binding flagellar brake protein YcgR